MIVICSVSWMSAFIRCNSLLQHNKPEIILSACRRLIEVVSHGEACCYEQNKFFYEPYTRTNIGKQYVSSTVVDLWQDLNSK